MIKTLAEIFQKPSVQCLGAYKMYLCFMELPAWENCVAESCMKIFTLQTTILECNIEKYLCLLMRELDLNKMC